MAVFRQSLVAHLGEAELAFHDTKDLLDLVPDARLVAIAGALRFGQLAVSAAFVLGEVAGSWPRSIPTKWRMARES